MREADRESFAVLLTDVMAFYRQDVSPFALSVWWQACQQFDIEQVRKALTAHAMDAERGQWAPKPADLVRMLQGTFTDRSLVAWGKVLDAAQRVGAYESVAFDDPAIHCAIVDLGGWQAVCRTDMDELPFLQKRFTDAHKAYAARPSLTYPARLAGDHEQSNALRGMPVVPPVLIGDPAKAAEVQKMGGESGKTQITGPNVARALELVGLAQSPAEKAAADTARHAAMSRLKKRQEGAIPARVEALAQGGEA